jgi:peptidoglycan/LPS O-acetylase OafA/YrhL
MTSNANRPGPEDGFLGLLRGAALVAVIAGAVGCFALMLHTGRRQRSLILIGLFTVWELSPFVGLVCAHVVSKRWPALTRAALYSVMLVVTLGSLAIYGVIALGPPRPQPAFVFLVVPLAAWLLIAIVLPIAALLSGRLSRRDHGA